MNQKLFQIGPPAGGFLYSVGGFLLPFLVMGVLALVIGIAMILCLTNENQNDNNRQRLFSLYAYVDTVSSSAEKNGVGPPLHVI